MKTELAQVKAAMDKVDEARAVADSWKEAFIRDHCPVKEGDVVEVNWLSHTGKRMKVEKIVLSKWCGDFEFRAYGKVIKANGEPGLNTAEWRQVIKQ